MFQLVFCRSRFQQMCCVLARIPGAHIKFRVQQHTLMSALGRGRWAPEARWPISLRGAGLDLRDRAPLLPGAGWLSLTAGGRSSLQPSDHRGCWFWECTRWPLYPAVPGSGRCDRAYLAGVRVQRPRDRGSRKPPAPALRPRMPRWPVVSPRCADTPLP